MCVFNVVRVELVSRCYFFLPFSIVSIFIYISGSLVIARRFFLIKCFTYFFLFHLLILHLLLSSISLSFLLTSNIDACLTFVQQIDTAFVTIFFLSSPWNFVILLLFLFIYWFRILRLTEKHVSSNREEKTTTTTTLTHCKMCADVCASHAQVCSWLDRQIVIEIDV